jgi:hypothetical protein
LWFRATKPTDPEVKMAERRTRYEPTTALGTVVAASATVELTPVALGFDLARRTHILFAMRRVDSQNAASSAVILVEASIGAGWYTLGTLSVAGVLTLAVSNSCWTKYRLRHTSGATGGIVNVATRHVAATEGVR